MPTVFGLVDYSNLVYFCKDINSLGKPGLINVLDLLGKGIKIFYGAASRETVVCCMMKDGELSMKSSRGAIV